MKSWVDLNTRGRVRAANEGDQTLKDFFKLMVNACFGKFIENQRTQRDIKIVTTREQALKLLNSPLTTSFTVVNENLMIFESIKRKIVINRPILIGVSILELSKMIMYQYYFKVLKEAFTNRIKLLYTDTDSFVVELKTDDLLRDLKTISHTLDTSNFQRKGHYLSELFSTKNISKLFYFKSEVGADEILAFIAIRAKVYTLIRAENGDGVGETIIKILSKLKGVNKDYVNTLGLYQ